jgi:hypothetical protein
MAVLKQIEVHQSDGLKQTLFQMQLLEKKSIENISFVTWVHETFNSNCVGCTPGKIWNYIQDNFTYQKDDPFDELITAPYLMPELKTGDCDDFSLFAKTCLDILGGYFTHYMLMGVNRNQFTHIVVFCHRGQEGNKYYDPVYIDGANKNFNIIPLKYNYFKIL